MRGKLLLVMGVLAIVSLAGGISGADGPDTGACNGENHKHAASGSCKDTDDHQIHCGAKGRLPGPRPAGISINVNQTDDGAEVEACSDEGVGNQHGRLILQVSEGQQGVRGVLDSDPDQPFDPGWIIVQGSAKDGNKSGLYCSSDAGETGTVRGDGYARSWANPGPDTNEDCVPNPPL